LGFKRIWVTTWPFRVTWLHWSRDQSIPRRAFPIGGPLEPCLCRFERRKVDKKANLHENWNIQTLFYSRVFGTFMLHVMKMYSYNFKLYRFKVGAFLKHNV